jgi:hypothetical protein
VPPCTRRLVDFDVEEITGVTRICASVQLAMPVELGDGDSEGDSEGDVEDEPEGDGVALGGSRVGALLKESAGTLYPGVWLALCPLAGFNDASDFVEPEHE